MRTSLSALITVLLVTAVAGTLRIPQVDHPAGSVAVKDHSRDTSAETVVLAQYTRCWNGRCR
jgi:hypothetical protein